jgi:hypothetical protein
MSMNFGPGLHVASGRAVDTLAYEGWGSNRASQKLRAAVVIWQSAAP